MPMPPGIQIKLVLVTRLIMHNDLTPSYYFTPSVLVRKEPFLLNPSPCHLCLAPPGQAKARSDQLRRRDADPGVEDRSDTDAGSTGPGPCTDTSKGTLVLFHISPFFSLISSCSL